MANQLTAAFVKTVKRPGIYGDMHGLRLRVSASGSKSFVWRGVVHGKRIDMGLGSTTYVTLVEARDKAFEYRRLARTGGDPRAERRKAAIPLFADAVNDVVRMYREGWKDGGKSEKQWRSSLDTYAMPRLGNKRVSEITTDDVMSVLLPIWSEKRPTAKRIRGRISNVMLWSIAKGYRSDDPAGPALTAILPKGNGHKENHHKALPHSEVAGAVAKIRASDAFVMVRLSLEFLILSAARSGEVRGATWSEFDLDAATWIIPSTRMKSGVEHRVPLSRRAVEILIEAQDLSNGNELVFPTLRGKQINVNTFIQVLVDLGIDCTAHGFRSSFRNWAAECSDMPREVCEAALEHSNTDKVEAAYLRSNLFQKRRHLMELWAEKATV